MTGRGGEDAAGVGVMAAEKVAVSGGGRRGEGVGGARAEEACLTRCVLEVSDSESEAGERRGRSLALPKAHALAL